ncbi:reverse transcriptase domain-containing protein [Tanacetum coccineum]
MLLDFNDVQDVRDDEIEVNVKGKAKVGDEDLSKLFKEVLKCPFTRRIVKFSSPGHRMPTNAKIYDGTGDPKDHVGRFVGIGNQGEWPMPVWCRMFQQTLDGKARAWFDKLPPEISEIVRRANETLPNFKERWMSESNSIPNVLEIMQISSLMSSHKCPELSKCFSDNIPKTIDEMLKRVDDYLQSEEAFPRDSVRIRQVKSSGEGCQAKGKKGTAKQRRKIDERPNNIPADLSGEALVVEGEIEGYLVRRIHVDEGASVEIMFEKCFNMLHPSIRARLVETQTIVSGFSREQVKPLGKIEIDVCFGPKAAQSYSIHHPWDYEVPSSLGNCNTGVPSAYNIRVQEGRKEASAYPKQLVVIEKGLSPESSIQLKNLLKKSKDIFAWEPADMTRGNNQRSRRMSKGRDSQARKIPYLDIKPSLGQEGGRNKIKSAVGFPLKFFLDAYKGYHQVHMAEEDGEKTAFYTDQGTYYYIKIPFGLKNTGATYQRLVDEAFQSQIGQNMEVYVDDMVVKCKSEREMLADIAETFDNLRRINMKLNPKKCSFGVEEGKLLGYMVTSKGIRANPVKTKDIVEMQPPKTWGDM